MLFCYLFTIVTQHQSSSQNNLMVFELFIPFLEPLVIVPRQIYRYVLTKLHLMSVPVFCCVNARHYRFEGKEKMGTHLIIKI